MSVTASSSLLIYGSLSLCSISFITYSDIGLKTSFKVSFTMRIVVCLFFCLSKICLTGTHFCFLILISFISLELSMTFIITELVHIFVKGPAEACLQVPEFLTLLKTHWWPSAVFCSFVLHYPQIVNKRRNFL